MLVELTDIGPRRVAFEPADAVHRIGIRKIAKSLTQTRGRGQHLGRLRTIAPLPRRSKEHRSGIRDLPNHHGAGDGRRRRRVVRPPVLFPAQQHVAAHRSLHPRQEMAVLGEKRYRHAALGAERHGGRSHRDVAEAHQRRHGVNRQAQTVLMLDAHHHGLSIARHPGALRGHIQRVQQLSHYSPAASLNCRSMYLATWPGRAGRAGMQRSISEQFLHFFS